MKSVKSKINTEGGDCSISDAQVSEIVNDRNNIQENHEDGEIFPNRCCHFYLSFSDVDFRGRWRLIEKTVEMWERTKMYPFSLGLVEELDYLQETALDLEEAS